MKKNNKKTLLLATSLNKGFNHISSLVLDVGVHVVNDEESEGLVGVGDWVGSSAARESVGAVGGKHQGELWVSEIGKGQISQTRVGHFRG